VEEGFNDWPKATMSVENAAIGLSGSYEFNWPPEAARITFTVTSKTAVYYEYYIGGESLPREEDWISYFPEARLGSRVILTFTGNPTGTPYEVVGNFDATVYFRIRNLAGSVAKFESKDGKPLRSDVLIRLDQRKPDFKIEATVDNQVIQPGFWQQSDVFIRLYPVREETISGQVVYTPLDPATANPGGVDYTYRVSYAGYMSIREESLPGNGTFFSTEDVAPYGWGGGEMTIYIYARARASQLDASESITLYIDKVKPTFELMGQIKQKGTGNDQEIASGTWTQAEEVLVNKRNEAKSPSQVTYTYYTSTNPTEVVWGSNEPLVLFNICTLYVTATNQAGATERREFDIKIDFTPPVIHSGMIQNNIIHHADGTEEINRQSPNLYYIDQIITFTEPNLKSAKYNNFPLPNGHTIATNTVDNSNKGPSQGTDHETGGYVHIVIEDMAGNKSELVFYMTVFELTINTITLSNEHRARLNVFEEQFRAAESGLSEDRKAYFQQQIIRLEDRLTTLRQQVDEYQAYLTRIHEKKSFTLLNDYAEMKAHLDLFFTADTSVVYAPWLQAEITRGNYLSYFEDLKNRFDELDVQMQTVLNVQKQVAELPAINVVTREDYPEITQVWDSYTSLLSVQTGVFSPNLLLKLQAVKRACEILRLQDPTTGITIDGKNLPTGISIEVVDRPKTTDYVNNAQRALLEMEPAERPRSIIYVKEITLTDRGSQFNHGDLTISLTIPSEFQHYRRFGVYRLTVDGTVIRMENVIINNYGDKVSFVTRLQGTYILTVNAEVDQLKPADLIYATVAGIEIDATLLTYITYVSVGLFGVMLLVVIFVAIRHRVFLKKYNRSYKRSVTGKGINAVPKGNGLPRTLPSDVDERLTYH
jgi:hypothetical protein